jgi:hypothetical protein
MVFGAVAIGDDAHVRYLGLVSEHCDSVGGVDRYPVVLADVLSGQNEHRGSLMDRVRRLVVVALAATSSRDPAGHIGGERLIDVRLLCEPIRPGSSSTDRRFVLEQIRVGQLSDLDPMPHKRRQKRDDRIGHHVFVFRREVAIVAERFRLDSLRGVGPLGVEAGR